MDNPKLEIGKYYTYNVRKSYDDKGKVIGILYIQDINSSGILKVIGIVPSRGKYYAGNPSLSIKRKYRLSTIEEIAHLDKCIYYTKYVDADIPYVDLNMGKKLNSFINKLYD